MDRILVSVLACFLLCGQFHSSLAADVCNTFDYTPFGVVDKPFECSGHGKCIDNETKCDCDEGWTGLSELINTEGIDCQINIYAVKGLWGFTMLVGMVFQYKGLGAFLYRWRNFTRTKAERQARGQKYGIMQSRVLLACFWFEFLCFPCTILLGIVRLSMNEERVGVTFLSTLLFGLAKIGFYMANYFYSPTILSMALKDGKKFLNASSVDQMITAYKHFTKALAAASIILGFLPFITYAKGGVLDKTAETVYLIYFVGMVVTISCLGLQSVAITIKAGRMFEASYAVSQDERIKQMKEKIGDMNKSAAKQSLIQVSFYMMFLVNPFMWNLHDYFLPISWISFIILGKKMMTATVRDDKSSTMKGSRKAGTQTQAGSKSRRDSGEHSYAMTAIIKQSSVQESDGSEV